MAEISQVRPQMDVIGSDGIKVGVVDHVDGNRIKLAKSGSRDGEHHYVAEADIVRVDEHVHLSSGAPPFM